MRTSEYGAAPILKGVPVAYRSALDAERAGPSDAAAMAVASARQAA